MLLFKTLEVDINIYKNNLHQIMSQELKAVITAWVIGPRHACDIVVWKGQVGLLIRFLGHPHMCSRCPIFLTLKIQPLHFLSPSPCLLSNVLNLNQHRTVPNQRTHSKGGIHSFALYGCLGSSFSTTADSVSLSLIP